MNMSSNGLTNHLMRFELTEATGWIRMPTQRQIDKQAHLNPVKRQNGQQTRKKNKKKRCLTK